MSVSGKGANKVVENVLEADDVVEVKGKNAKLSQKPRKNSSEAR